MSLITTIIDGLAPNPSTGLGGANEGYIQGFQDDIISGVAGGVVDKAGGQCAITQNSPLGMSVLIADGIVYVPNADYVANVASEPKFYRVAIKDEDTITIPSNSSGSDCQHGIDIVIDKVTTPNEYASNVASIAVTLGTPGAGAPAVPDNGYRLAEVEVVNGATQIANVSITDTRTQIAINDVVLSTNVVTKTATQTLSQKTLTSPVINTSFSGTAKASAAEVATGTDDTKIVTPKALGDAGVNTRLASKVISITRDMTAASGNVAYTGVGFQPTSLVFMGWIEATHSISFSVVDSGKSVGSVFSHLAANMGGSNTAIYMQVNGSNYQGATVSTFGADGFTLAWTKTGSPTGTAVWYVLCLR